MATPNNAVTKYPELLTNDKLEIAYVGMLHNNPKVQKAVRRETIDKTLPGVRFR